MSGAVVYLDASAIVKLIVAEPGSGELLALLADATSLATSVVAAVEVPRAIARYRPDSRAVAASVLDGMTLIGFSSRQATEAATVRPLTLRSLDAIHLAAALNVRDELSAFVTYDRRLADAARLVDVPVLSPGVDL